MNILLLDGGKAFAHSHGKLNHTLHDIAKQTLTEIGHSIRETVMDDGYQIEQEIDNFLWADAIIWQMPGWWMGEPWTVKKYIDEVFTAGHGKLYQSDGRHRVNPSEGYGTGGLLQGKKFMLSLTWNAPIEAFERADDFFEGQGVDGLYLHFHKANEFLGMSRLPTFIVNDVIKNPQIEAFTAAYRAHLLKVFGANQS
ncbi:modulator of drug activity B [Pasteurella testudinis DSM 23072]|uniref:Modulator of drug activity B n=1 Tax=Pasteurella testudinis DSM 23072 TaxID=1122938 RepID=A0A1W1V740_9PAST|nr:NAD(P)H-dependent oxidoreductase [Pasteurella testudinis]SMB89115.1 modulator of drug activity B [Pasteurella testudinis DSM 23072]SUB50198.1 Modulator of drug activity B [Pasteurella testudinis]